MRLWCNKSQPQSWAKPAVTQREKTCIGQPAQERPKAGLNIESTLFAGFSDELRSIFAFSNSRRASRSTASTPSRTMAPSGVPCRRTSTTGVTRRPPCCRWWRPAWPCRRERPATYWQWQEPRLQTAPSLQSQIRCLSSRPSVHTCDQWFRYLH